MDTVELKAHAKINLCLDIIGRRPDGYHELRMIMQTLELHDRIRIDRRQEGIRVKMLRYEFVPEDERNLAFRAARRLMEEFSIREGVEITIDKRIPVAAGLGGGSSDAAAVLKGMNTLFELGLDTPGLQKRGLELGADVPFCIEGGTRLSEGIGERLSPLPPAEGRYVLLAKPPRGVSTREVYQGYDERGGGWHPDVDGMARSLEDGSSEGVMSRLGNVLEDVTIPMVPDIDTVKRCMLDKGARGALMSGSGPTVFGFFPDMDTLLKARGALVKQLKKLLLINTCVCIPEP